jgi:tripartite-type tricarboxylate transporter receptor subunit TctC
MTTTRWAVCTLTALAAALGASAQAPAQPYPNKPIRMIVPSTPGSPTDVMARLVAQSMSSTIGQTVFVEPRPGGGGIIGTKAVIAAEPDGTTLLFTEGAKHLMTPALYDSVGFDPVTDVTPVATAGGGSFVLVVHPDVPAKSVQDLVAYARANPGKINFGFGQGTLPHMLGETLKVTAKVDITSVPYKGGAQAVADMLGGHIQMNFGTTATLLALIKQGKLRALAVTNDARLAELPDVPTMAESGFSNLTLRYWMAVWAPPRTPAAIVDKLNADVVAGLKSPELTASMAKAGFEPMPMDAKAVASFIASESPKWLAVAKTSGVKGD